MTVKKLISSCRETKSSAIYEGLCVSALEVVKAKKKELREDKIQQDDRFEAVNGGFLGISFGSPPSARQSRGAFGPLGLPGLGRRSSGNSSKAAIYSFSAFVILHFVFPQLIF